MSYAEAIYVQNLTRAAFLPNLSRIWKIRRIIDSGKASPHSRKAPARHLGSN